MRNFNFLCAEWRQPASFPQNWIFLQSQEFDSFNVAFEQVDPKQLDVRGSFSDRMLLVFTLASSEYIGHPVKNV